MPIGTGFDKHIGTRASTVDPSQTEYFNKSTNQGFANAGEVAAYASSLNSGQDITPDTVFGVLEKGFTPAAPVAPAVTNLDPTAAPTATALLDLPTPQAPSITSGFLASASADLTAKSKAVDDTYQKRLDTITKEKDAAQKEMDGLTEAQGNLIANDIKPLTQPFREDMEKKERERLKVEENFFANQGIVNELQSLLTQGNEAIKQAQGESMSRGVGQMRVNQMISDISARAGVLDAVLAARNGQIAQAQTLIDRSVTAVTADKQDQLNYYNTLFNFHETQKDDEGAKLLDLTTEERKFIDLQIGTIESQLEDAKATATYIKDLMIDPETSKFVADAGITLNDSVATINKKMADQTARIERQEQQKMNREEAFNAGISTQYYDKQGTIVRSSDGFEFEDPEQFLAMTGMTLDQAGAKGLIGELSANYLAEREQVGSLMASYPDAGIRATDTITQAEAKLSKSRIYQDEVRPPVSAGGGPSTEPGDDPQLYVGLTPQTATAVRSQVSTFKSEPLVQNFATVQEGRNFASSISDTTKNPADDQALIYSLAKALDPGSVVREGEYKTAEKYTQSWIKAYGKGIEQALYGTGFLSVTARKNIKATIEQKYQSSKRSYDNLSNQYADSISTLTGRGDGQKFLKSYVTPSQPASDPSYVGPQPAGQAATTNEPEEQRGFWSSVGNWLWGND